MPNITLSEARVKALRPRPTAYDIRDAKLRGFGVRVLPSGAKRFFIHTQHRGTRIWKMVGDATAINVDAARARAASMLAAIRGAADASPDAMRFETVAETVFRRYARVWKPRTLYVNRSYLRRQILPWFAETQIADITRADVQRWFASCRATPVAADRSMPVLSVIMKEAERMGYRPEGSNSCRGIRRYRRKGRERFLSDAEIGRLAARLSAHEGRTAAGGGRGSTASAHRVPQERGADASLVRLPRGPLVPARRQDRAEDGVAVARRAQDPRPNRPHRRLGLPGTTCQWAGRPGVASLRDFWHRVRAEADLSDVRLHDLRHAHATFALRYGESVLAIGRLLGHASPHTTLKYTHLADAMVREAVETVGAVLGGADR